MAKKRERLLDQRRAGVLAHITSLPGPYGIGDLASASSFLDFLAEAGQSCWQFLPTGPVAGAFAFSPYMGLSAMAGNFLLISPELMVRDGLILADDISAIPQFSQFAVDFSLVADFKYSLLRKAARRFQADDCLQDGFAEFCRNNSWLDDFALYMAIRQQYGEESWVNWPALLRRRDPGALAEKRRELEKEIMFYSFVQFVFNRQWQRLRRHAASKNICLVGDLPFYVGFDSADVWANQSSFELADHSCQPLHVAGVPPDYFSPHGQRWGNPLYRWQLDNKPNPELYKWWDQRFASLSKLVDVVRIDHFRGFESCWQIPASSATAVNGSWSPGPGADFFRQLGATTDNIEIIAEDLGHITEAVIELRDELGFPGMRVLQFAFDSDEANLYLPHNYQTANTVVYSGTHDNDTSVGWYYDPKVAESSKDRFRRYVNSDGGAVNHDFIRLAYSSVASLAVIPLQDILGYGSDCRMNTPGTVDGNWIWRCDESSLSGELAQYLSGLTKFYGRNPSQDEDG